MVDPDLVFGWRCHFGNARSEHIFDGFLWLVQDQAIRAISPRWVRAFDSARCIARFGGTFRGVCKV